MSFSHSATLDRVRRRICDKRLLALVKAFLKAGIIREQGRLQRTLTGTPQGGVPLAVDRNVALNALDEDFAARLCTAAGDHLAATQAPRPELALAQPTLPPRLVADC